MVKCKICGVEKNHSIVEHLKYVHSMTTIEYKNLFNNADVKSIECKIVLSEKMKKKWENNDFRNKLTEIRNITHKNPLFRKEMSEKIKNKYKENPELFSGFTQWHKTEKFKVWVKSDERINKISKTSKERWKDNDYRERTINTLKKVLIDGRCNKSNEFRENMSKKIAELYSEGIITNYSNKYKTGFFLSKKNETFFYSSSYELKSMEIFDNSKNIKNWTNKHGIKIKYYYNGINRYYIPDFFIEFLNGKSFVIELKGWYTEEVGIKEEFTNKEYNNYKIFYNIEDLKKFIDENK